MDKEIIEFIKWDCSNYLHELDLVSYEFRDGALWSRWKYKQDIIDRDNLQGEDQYFETDHCMGVYNDYFEIQP